MDGIVCWFAKLPDAGPCEGQLVRCHLLPQQLLKREFPEGIGGEAGVPRDADWPGGYTPLEALLKDTRCWVPGCGGLQGVSGHHGQLDTARTLRIPRAFLPDELEEYAGELGLTWWLDREYGSLEAAA